MPQFELAGRLIGPDHPPLVIAEIGINHNGDVEVAKAMIDAAAAAGGEVVKFQSHVIDDEMSHHARSTIPGNADVSIYDIMEACALTEAEERELKRHAESKGLIFLSTPFSRAAADRLQAMDVAAFKIGSGECNNYPLVEHISRFGKPIILSTGMNTIAQVARSVEIMRAHGVPYALLHCTNVYPTPPELVRLGAMTELAAAFPDAVIGLSDHTIDNAACLGAAALGASILERHFTDTKARPGPDIVCSMTPDEMSQLIAWSAALRTMRGGAKGPVAAEQPTIDFAYASVVSIAPIRAGERLTPSNIWVKRPGTGEILADRYDDLLGRVAARDIPPDAQVGWSDLEPVASAEAA
jgi:sialic acid synthase SpsE